MIKLFISKISEWLFSVFANCYQIVFCICYEFNFLKSEKNIFYNKKKNPTVNSKLCTNCRDNFMFHFMRVRSNDKQFYF